MICPKCQNLMQTVNRRGVHIEQCQGCRGIFLDRGELEQIAGAEQTYYAAPTPPQYRGDSPPPYGGSYGYDPRHQGQYRDSPPPHGAHGGKRRRSFFDELFD